MLGSPRRDLLTLILATLLLRLFWAAGLDLANDEAYHFLYTVHPDWSYFDHPPMLMWVASAGRVLMGGWIHPLSLRLGFVFLFAGSTWVLFDWTSRWYGERAGFYAALAMNLAAYYTAAAGTFVLPDGPFLFFALLTMRALSQALSSPGAGIASWVRVGLYCASAMSSKYHAVLLPLGTFAYIILTPKAWSILRTPGPYVAAALSVVGLAPVLIWNAQHDWASIAFQGGRAIGFQLSSRGLMAMIFGPIGYLLPWVWFPAVAVLTLRLRNFRHLPGHDRFLVCLSIVPLTLFFLVSCVRPILPHWPLIGFVPMLPLVGALWAENAEKSPSLVQRWVTFMTAALLVMMGGFYCQAHFGWISVPWRSDPALEISGWDSVGRQLRLDGVLDRPNSFLFSDHWYDSGQLAFSVRNKIPVACYNEGDARGFAYWSHPEEWLGRDGFYISADEAARTDDYRPYFQSVDIFASFPMTRSGRPFRMVNIYLCSHQIKPFPFQYGRHLLSTASTGVIDAPGSGMLLTGQSEAANSP